MIIFQTDCWTKIEETMFRRQTLASIDLRSLYVVAKMFRFSKYFTHKKLNSLKIVIPHFDIFKFYLFFSAIYEKISVTICQGSSIPESELLNHFSYLDLAPVVFEIAMKKTLNLCFGRRHKFKHLFLLEFLSRGQMSLHTKFHHPSSCCF